MRALMAHLDWPLLVVLCLTLGLAPFTPPHILEKLQMLSEGTLKRPLDWFDLFFHGIPWLLLIIKALYALVDSYLPK
ncbi:MAG: RND transporter [Desulfurivibrionaceae bacterium]|nr:RND transporter [Desulfurivibrionaceae bacterium]